MLQRLDRWLTALPAAGVWGLGLALTALVGAVDVATGPELSPAAFYLAPIGLAAWYGGRRTGVVFALLSAVVLYTADRLTGGVYSRALVPVWNAGGRLAIFLVTAALVAGLRRALEHERELAATDPLTGVANCRSFFAMAERELDRARRYGRPLTLAYLDLDNFKAFNDVHGFLRGDQVILLLATALRRAVIDGDIENGALMAGQSVGIFRMVCNDGKIYNFMEQTGDGLEKGQTVAILKSMLGK